MSPIATSPDAKSGSPMLPEGLDTAPWQHFQSMFQSLLAEEPRSKKFLPRVGSHISSFSREYPNGGKDQGKDHSPLFLFKWGHYAVKTTSTLGQKKYYPIPTSLVETVNCSLVSFRYWLSPVKHNPQKLGLDPKFIFSHISTQTVRASAVPMSPCS